MPSVILQWGSTPELSQAEFSALFPKVSFQQLLDDFIQTDSSQEKIEQAQLQLGGLLRILKPISKHPLGSSEADLYLALIDSLTTIKTDSKITFGLAEFGRDHLPKLDASELKSHASSQQLRTRYLESSRSGINAAQFKYNSDVAELVVIQSANHILVAQTLWMQDPDEWSRRDRQRPYSDRKKGMLPLKVARMMVNIATQSHQSLVIDPFCGAGSILSEALLLGHPVFGSDTDSQAVQGSLENISYLKTDKSLPEAVVKVADATTVNLPSTNLPKTIVTEPFLGKPKPRPEQVSNIIKGLTKLYIGSLRNWSDQLSTGERVCMVVPVFEYHDQWRAVTKFIDKLDTLGYDIESEPIMYHRKRAVVRRQIWVLKKK